MSASRTLFVGLGSPHGDDQIGWRVAEELRRREPDRPVRIATTPAELLDWLEGLDQLDLCDAVRGEMPGQLHCWDWPTPQLGRLRSSLTLDQVPLRCRCRACGQDFQVRDIHLECPGCGSIRVQVTGGDEFRLLDMTIRERIPAEGGVE